jgi:hypothetical protein
VRGNFVGHKFWASGYFVSTVGADETVIKAYIPNQEQEKEAKRMDDLFDRIFHHEIREILYNSIVIRTRHGSWACFA